MKVKSFILVSIFNVIMAVLTFVVAVLGDDSKDISIRAATAIILCMLLAVLFAVLSLKQKSDVDL